MGRHNLRRIWGTILWLLWLLSGYGAEGQGATSPTGREYTLLSPLQGRLGLLESPLLARCPLLTTASIC